MVMFGCERDHFSDLLVTDESELKKYVRSSMIQRGSATVDEEIVQQIVDTAGSNFLQLNRLAECLDPRSEIASLVEQQTLVLREMCREQNEAYKLLLKVNKGNG